MRLSENALHLLKTRYLLQDNESNIIEEPKELMLRVSNLCKKSKVKNLQNTIYNHLISLDFLPNSPTVMNANAKNGNLSACISGDTYIYTKNGIKYMKDITTEDYVLTHTGNFRKVTKIWSNGVKDTIQLAHGTNKRKKFNLTCTHDHKILDINNDWVTADSIHSHHANVPNLWKSDIPFPNQFKMSTFNAGISNKILIQNGRVEFLRKGRAGRKGLLNKQTNSCLDVVENDDILARIFGLFLSNGNLNKYTTRFCFNVNDKKNIDFLMNNFEKKFGVHASLSKSNFGEWVDIKVECKYINTMLKETLGTLFKNKKIPEWIANAPNSYKKNLFDGLMADAHENSIKKLTIVLANPTMVYQALLLGRNLGYIANFKADAKELLSKHPTSKAQFIKSRHNANGEITRLNNIVKSEGNKVEVFDMEVEKDHSFIAGDFIVHNCFVLPIHDSMESIFDGVKNTALIHQTGGGTGFNFSELRPAGAPVKTTQGVASGPLSFMKVFDASTDTIKQGGKRRGANMGILDISHPDIIKFITSKKDGELKNFNISVMITDNFMEAVEKDLPWNLTFKDKIYNTLPARELFSLLVTNAWETGDPGILFYDEINRKNPQESLVATNPCGEQPLEAYESCNLASINLNNILTDDSKPTVDFKKLVTITTNVIHFLNCVIDNNHFPLPEIKKATLKTRKVGLGVMGFADLLTKLGLVYGSEDSLAIASRIMKTIQDTAHKVSKEHNYENQNLTTIAPTGSISILANVSSGIEPYFAIVYKRNLKETLGKDLFDINPTFLKISKEQGFYSEDLIKKIYENSGTLTNIPEIPDEIKSLFKTAHEILPSIHIEMQSTFQKHTDSAVSKTINLPSNATPKDVEVIYIQAFKSKCKGITIFRDNCKGADNQVFTTSSTPTPTLTTPRERKQDHIAIFREIRTGCGVFYCGLTFDEHGLLEVFPISSGKGGCTASQDAIGRSCSLMLRSNLAPKLVIKQLARVKCNACILREDIKVKSCSDGISILMDDYHNNSTILTQLKEIQTQLNKPISTILKLTTSTNESPESPNTCKNCGSTNLLGDHCKTCRDCGISSC